MDIYVFELYTYIPIYVNICFYIYMNEIVKFTSSRWPFKALAASAGEIDVGPSEKSSYVQDVNVDIPIGSNCMVYTHTYIYIFVLVFFCIHTCIWLIFSLNVGTC